MLCNSEDGGGLKMVEQTATEGLKHSLEYVVTKRCFSCTNSLYVIISLVNTSTNINILYLLSQNDNSQERSVELDFHKGAKYYQVIRHI